MSGRILEGPRDNNQLPLKSLGIIFYDGLKKWDPERVAIVDTNDVEVTFGELLNLSVKIAKKLQSLGLKTGDVITLISQNRWEYLATILAGFYLGVTVNLLNPDYTSGELKHFLSTCKPAVVFCTSKVLRNLLPLQNESSFPTHIVTYDDKATPPAIHFDDFLCDVTDISSFVPVDLDPKEQVAFIITSSGSTGLPKCVQLTHANFRTTMLYTHDPHFMDVTETDSIVALLPFFHIFGNCVALGTLLYGGRVSILEKFTSQRFLQIIQEQKVTKLYVVPSILLFLAKHPLVATFDLSSVCDIISGAASASKELEQVVLDKLNVASVRQVYGMTEVCGAATMIPKGVSRHGSSGKVGMGHSIKVCDPETGKLLPPGQTGEIRIKGDGVMKGYLGNDTETANSFDEDGFLKSGDLGYYDQDGYVYIVDRLKEIIKYKGFQVSPNELEALLIKHCAVKDVGVVGIPDERAGEVPVAFVVKQPGEEVTEEQLQKYVAENLSVQKHLYGGVRFVEELPKNPTGKILRRKLRELV